MKKQFSNYTIPHLHSLVCDYKRTNAYAEFLSSGICQDKVVVDCGAGSGILTYLALCSGATSVISCDHNPNTCEYLRKVFADSPNVSVVQLNVCTDVLPAGDLYIHEIVGNALLGEGVSHMFSNMRSQNISNVYPSHAKISVGDVHFDKKVPSDPQHNGIHQLHKDAQKFTEFLPDFEWNSSHINDYVGLNATNVQELYTIDLREPIPDHIKERHYHGDIIWEVGFDTDFNITYTNMNDSCQSWIVKMPYNVFLKYGYIESFDHNPIPVS